jgi:hypothetical protein
MSDKRLEVVKSMNEHYDGLFKRVHYLFVGNGAGFAGGLSFLKEYHDIRWPVLLFGTGLLAAVFTYVGLAAAQTAATNAALSSKVHQPSQVVFYLHYGSLLVSSCAFILAICVAMYRVASL